MARKWEVVVEDAFLLTGRGVAVTGVHSGDEIRTGDAAAVADGETRVSEVFVENHHASGKIALLLRGVAAGEVSAGDRLIGPT